MKKHKLFILFRYKIYHYKIKMENKNSNIQKEMFLPTTLLKDIEFDQLDRELLLLERNETIGSTINER